MESNGIRTRVSSDALELSSLPSDWTDGSAGAVVLFFGVVRKENEGRKVREIEYDGASPLAEKLLFEIGGEAQKKFGDDVRIFVQHRLGLLKLGEVSVVIAVASAHRHEAYEASRYVIEELKKRVPIWKREVYEDGSEAWLRGCSHHAHT